VLATSLCDEPAAELHDDALARLREHLALPAILLRFSHGVQWRRTLPNVCVCLRSAVSVPGRGPSALCEHLRSRSCDTKQVLEFTGAPSVALDGWTIRVQRGLPSTFDAYCSNAKLVDQFDMKSTEGDFCFVSAGPVDADWPDLVVAQHFSPAQGGFDPGVAFLPERHLLFIGAGTRLLAYDLKHRARLWEDAADMGFWSWSVYPNAVLMAAELELAAWDRTGRKLWSRFVEPPWSFRVVDDKVHLDVMGKHTEFSLLG